MIHRKCHQIPLLITSLKKNILYVQDMYMYNMKNSMLWKHVKTLWLKANFGGKYMYM